MLKLTIKTTSKRQRNMRVWSIMTTT